MISLAGGFSAHRRETRPPSIYGLLAFGNNLWKQKIHRLLCGCSAGLIFDEIIYQYMDFGGGLGGILVFDFQLSSKSGCGCSKGLIFELIFDYFLIFDFLKNMRATRTKNPKIKNNQQIKL